MRGTDLAVGEPVRRSAGRAIIAGLALAAVFAAVTVAGKEIRGLDVAPPWQDDPYEVLVSLDFAAVPLLVVIGAMRVQLCRRYEPLPARRLVDVLRVAAAVLVVCLATEGAEWVAVALGSERAAWTAATMWQVTVLALLTVASIAALVRVRRVARDVFCIAAAAPQPDWLADAVAVGVRATRFLGRHRGGALAVIGQADVWVFARVRAHPIAAAGLLAALLALPFVATKIAIEGHPVQLVLLVFAFVTASLFVVVVGGRRLPARCPAAAGRDARH